MSGLIYFNIRVCILIFFFNAAMLLRFIKVFRMLVLALALLPLFTFLYWVSVVSCLLPGFQLLILAVVRMPAVPFFLL